jgi:predicted lipid-binding transport protein (Tim44 family)
VAIGWLIATSLVGSFGVAGPRGHLLPLFLGTALVVFVTIVRCRQARSAQPGHENVAVSSLPTSLPPPVTTARPGGDSSLDQGLRDIRRADPKFDPARFTGYIEMVFRSTHKALISGDVGSLRDRVTPQLYDELQAQAERLRSVGHAGRVEEIEIRAEVTEAWHENGRDYVTAYIGGSMLDYTVAEMTSAVVAGSKTVPRAVDAFLTFTRRAGLNPWMLSASQTT